MNYYLVRGTSDPKIIGIKDGSIQARLIRNKSTNSFTYDYFEKYYHGGGLKMFDSNPEQKLNLGLIELNKKAKRVDFLTFYPNAKANGEFILSNKAATLFREFNLPKCEFIPVTITQNDEIIDSYEYMFCPCLGYEFIDFKSSSFYRGDHFERQYVTVNNGQEWETYKKKLFYVENIVLRGVASELDYFTVKVAMINFFISERLKEAIERENLKGLNILPLRQPYEPRIEIR